MTCVMCRHADPELGFTALTLALGGFTTVVNHVPAHVCPECGEAYLDEAVVRRVLAQAAEMAAETTEE